MPLYVIITMQMEGSSDSPGPTADTCLRAHQGLSGSNTCGPLHGLRKLQFLFVFQQTQF